MRVLGLLGALVVPFALAACGSSDSPSQPDRYAPDATVSAPPATSATPPAVPEPTRGVPEGAGEGVRSPAGVVAGEDGLIRVVTFGSSSNPAIVRGASADGQTVTVDVSDVPDRPATMDYVPTTSAFVLPSTVDPTRPITFVLGDKGTVVLRAAEPGAEAWVEIAD